MASDPLPCASKRAYPAPPIRVYLCTYCSKWHLTSKAKRPA